MSKELTTAEKKLIVYLLRRASDEFSNHGCNDLELVRDVGLTPEESFQIRMAMHERSDDPERVAPSKKSHYENDWCAMLFAADRIEEL